MTLAPDLALFRNLFVHADDAYATPGSTGIPNAIREPLDDVVLRRHLAGEARILAYFVDTEGFASAICIDIDEHKPELARRIAEEFEQLGFDPWIEASKSKGFHVWALTERVPAGVLRTIGLYVAQKSGAPDLEVFPKQAQRTEGGLGNGVWLPLFGADVHRGKTVFLNRGNGFDPYPDQDEVLTGIVRASLETIGAAQAAAEATLGKAGHKKKEPVPDAIPAGKRRDTLTRIAGANRRLGLGEAEIYPILAEVNRTRCDPPVPDDQVRAIAKSIMRYAPGAPIGTDAPKTAPVVDKNNAASLDFPGHVMTGAAGAFAEVYSAVLEPSPPFFYVSFLACLGALLAGKLTLSSEIQPPSRLYAVLLGESADDRKSTAIKATVDFFRKFMSRFPISWGVGSAEGLQKELEENPRLLLALDELKQFVSKCKIEGSVLLACVTSLFENSFYSARTKTTSVKLDNVHLSLLAASTVQTFETMFGAAFIDIGFLNRLWIVPGAGARRFSIPGRIPEADLKTLRLLLGDVLQIAETVREMNISSEAREMFDRWYLSLPQTVHAKRIDTYALRLMPLLAVNDRKKEVDTETVRKVIDLCDHQVRVRQLYDPVDTDNAVAGVEEKIRRNLRLKGPLSERDLKRGVHASRIGLWMYNQAKTNLIRAREVRYDKGEGVYFIQPGAGV